MAFDKVVDSVVLDSGLTSIADSIRETSRTEEQLDFPEGFKTAVDNIVTGQKFWDIYQNKGERTNYSYAFYGDGWTDETFNPKYDLILNNSQHVFYDSDIDDFEGILKRNNVKIKLSGNVSALFCNSAVAKIPPLDMSDVTGFNEGLRACNITDAVLLNINDKRTKPQAQYGSFFGYCFAGSKIVNLTITGVLYSTILISIQSLSTQSAKNVLLCLYDWSQTQYAFDSAIQIMLHSDVWDALDSEGATAPEGLTWKEYVISKGWNI